MADGAGNGKKKLAIKRTSWPIFFSVLIPAPSVKTALHNTQQNESYNKNKLFCQYFLVTEQDHQIRDGGKKSPIWYFHTIILFVT